MKTETTITIDGDSIKLTLDQAKEWNADSEKTCYVCDTFGISLNGEDDEGMIIDQTWQQDYIEKELEQLLRYNNVDHESFWFSEKN